MSCNRDTACRPPCELAAPLPACVARGLRECMTHEGDHLGGEAWPQFASVVPRQCFVSGNQAPRVNCQGDCVLVIS